MVQFFDADQPVSVESQLRDIRHPADNPEKVLQAEVRVIEIQDSAEGGAVGADDHGLSGVVPQDVPQGFHIPFLYGTEAFAVFFRPGKIRPPFREGIRTEIPALPFPEPFIRPDIHVPPFRRGADGIHASFIGTAQEGVDLPAPEGFRHDLPVFQACV